MIIIMDCHNYLHKTNPHFRIILSESQSDMWFMLSQLVTFLLNCVYTELRALCSWCNCVLTCSHAYLLCLTCLCIYVSSMLAYLRALLAYVLVCLVCLCANVPVRLTCPRAYVLKYFTCLRACVLGVLLNSKISYMEKFVCIVKLILLIIYNS